MAGKGDGTFAAPAGFAVGGRPECIAVGGFSGGPKADLAVVNKLANNVSVLTNKTP